MLPDGPAEARAVIESRLAELRAGHSRPMFVGIDIAKNLEMAFILQIAREILSLKGIRAVLVKRRDWVPAGSQSHLALNAQQHPIAVYLVQTGAPTINITRFLAAANGNPGALALLREITKGKSPAEIEQIVQGHLYGMKHGLVVPDKRLLLAAKPRIITANEILIEKLRKEPQGLYDIDPRKFEEVVAELMNDMGYQVELTPRSADGGKDILASLETEHGKVLCLVEAKRHSFNNPVEVGLVRQLYGTLCDFNASSAMLVTTSRFTRGANEFQQRNQYRLALKDYGNVVQWLSNYRTSRRGS